MKSEITNEEFSRTVHPKENSRYIFALIITIPVIIVGVVLTFSTFGLALIFIGFIILSTWFILNILQASLIANSVRVSEYNFPEILQIYSEVKNALSYDKEIPIYVVQDGDINAFLSIFFRTKFIILNSVLIEGINKEEDYVQIKWIIARFIGAFRAKHFRMNIFKIMIDSIEKIKIFNFFILPYERAIIYTGDNIGLLLCEDLEQVMIAFDKFMVGNQLCQKINMNGIFEQSKDVENSFFALLARLSSTHPHLTSRYLNLLSFAKKEFPDQYESYVKKYDVYSKMNIDSMLTPY